MTDTKRPKIQVGYRVGKLTVIEMTAERRQGYAVWRCKCDCGGEILLDTRYLQRGTVRDCGCGGKVKAGQKDLTGLRFGRLVCIEPTEKRGPSGGTVWKCKCDCGNECLAVSTQLTQGYKKSCGCLSKGGVKDYVGRRFGALTVVSYEGKRLGQHRWGCRCDCGKELVVGQTRLQSGQTVSCGCKRCPPVGEYVGKRFGTLTVIGFAGSRGDVPYWLCRDETGGTQEVEQSKLSKLSASIGSEERSNDLTGRVFGRLKVLGLAERKEGVSFWLCQCACGNETVVRYSNLLNGHTKSCGCLQREAPQRNMRFVAGTSVTMLERCLRTTIRTNTSGYNGVYRNKRNGTWAAQITFRGKTYYLGSYTDIRDAVNARRQAEKMYDEFLDWYYREIAPHEPDIHCSVPEVALVNRCSVSAPAELLHEKKER